MSREPAKRLFHLASEAEIKAGEVHDVYFGRTVQILRHRGDTKRAKAEVRLKGFPQADWRWGILAGIEEAAVLVLVRDLPPPRTIRDYVLEQLGRIELSVARTEGLRGDY